MQKYVSDTLSGPMITLSGPMITLSGPMIYIVGSVKKFDNACMEMNTTNTNEPSRLAKSW